MVNRGGAAWKRNSSAGSLMRSLEGRNPAMSAPPQHRWTREDYDRDAREYLAGLPPEHFMESTPQSTQREITVASLALLRERCPLVRYFGELLIQTFFQGRISRVVPDNMVVLGALDD